MFGSWVEQIFAITEKGEVVVVEPAQEILDLGNLGGRHGWRGLCRQLAANLLQRSAHRLPVRDPGPDIGKDARQCLRQACQACSVRFPRDLDVHPRFAQSRRFPVANFAQPPVRTAHHGQDRVDDQMNDAVAGIDRPGNRIDQEGHVVIDDLDDRMRRRPTVRGRVRIVDPDLRLTGVPTLGEAPQRQSGAAEVAGAPFGDVGRWHVRIKFANDSPGARAPGRVSGLAGERSGLFDQPRLLRFDRARHPASGRLVGMVNARPAAPCQSSGQA